MKTYEIRYCGSTTVRAESEQDAIDQALDNTSTDLECEVVSVYDENENNQPEGRE